MLWEYKSCRAGLLCKIMHFDVCIQFMEALIKKPGYTVMSVGNSCASRWTHELLQKKPLHMCTLTHAWIYSLTGGCKRLLDQKDMLLMDAHEMERLFTNHNNFRRHGLLTNSASDEVLQLLHSWHLVSHYCWISDWDLVCCFKVITHKLTTWVKWQNQMSSHLLSRMLAKKFLWKQKAKACQIPRFSETFNLALYWLLQSLINYIHVSAHTFKLPS